MSYKLDMTLPVFEAENIFYLRAPVNRIGKQLAHYELYKKIVDIPGAVVEAGVFKGASLMRWAAFRTILEYDDSRQIIGFDAFGKFPRESTTEDDKKFIEDFEGSAGVGIDEDTLKGLLKDKKIGNVDLVKGDVTETVGRYIEENKHMRIALLHLDLDVYEATKTCLEKLFDRIVVGGIVVVDDYNAVAGATQAIDEFIRENNISLKKLVHYNVPSYFVKSYARENRLELGPPP